MPVYPTAAGVPSHSGSYIPEIWSGKLLTKFYKSTVFAAISNTDYEGEIKEQGDTVHINVVPDIAISDYVKGQRLSHQQPESTPVDLLIDKGKYWSILDDRVDRAQSMIDRVESWTTDASEQMKIQIDADILADVYVDADAANKGATAGLISGAYDLGSSGAPLGVNSANILETLVACGTVLDEQNIPETGRWVVLPPWATGLIKISDLKDASLAGDGTSILRNGRVGMIDRFEVYQSNNIATTTDTATVFNCIFGHPKALTFASQLTENEGPIKSPDYFGDVYRGLQVFGWKVTNPEALGHLYINKAAEA
jgi:hypothetical protein